jgi:hypothetical protein
MERISQLEPGLVELRLAVSHGTIKHGCYLIMLKALHVVKDKNQAITSRQSSNCSFEGEAVDRPGKGKIGGSKAASWTIIKGWLHRLVERHEWETLLAKMHEYDID